MRLYFGDFRPEGGGSNMYSALLRTLQVTGALASASFATLNDECLLELSGAPLGIDFASGGPHSSRQVFRQRACTFCGIQRPPR
jgi:hypothetical protein